MRAFLRDRRGAVTVFVTLLLIPTILVTGTAVDITRIYTARASVRNANQLAANAALSHYEAALKDIYGLYAIADVDKGFDALLKEYVNATLITENTAPGAFNSFRGKVTSVTVQPNPFPAPDTTLANPDVILRQIEEYMKFRAPVIIVDEIISRLEQFTKIKNDAEAILKKMEVDEKVGELGDLYEELFYRVRFNDLYVDSLGGKPVGYEVEEYGAFNAGLHLVCDKMPELVVAAEEWQALKAELDALEPPSEGDNDQYEQALRDYEAKVEELEGKMADKEDEFNAIKGMMLVVAQETQARQPVQSCGSHSGPYFSFYRGACCLDAYVDNVEEMGRLAEKIGAKVDDIRSRIDELDGKLDSCSDELAGSESSPGMRAELEQYEELFYDGLTIDVGKIREPNKNYIENVKNHINNLRYGDVSPYNNETEGKDYSLSEIVSIISTATVEEVTRAEETLHVSQPEYKIYYAHTLAVQPDHRYRIFTEENDQALEFFAQLSLMYGDEDGQVQKAAESNKKVIKQFLNGLGKELSEEYGRFDNSIRGQTQAPDWFQATADKNIVNASAEDFSDMGESSKGAQNQLNKALDVFSDMGKLLGNAVDKVLLLTYDSEMFSHFATRFSDPEETVSMSGYPYQEKLNHFLDAELEYLFNGSHSADENLNAVSGMLLLTRFVFNYIATFTITPVRTMLVSIQSLFAPLGPFSFLIKELARVGFAFGESVLDVASLRGGGAVAIFKTDKTWEFLSISKVLDKIGTAALNAAAEIAVSSLKELLLPKIQAMKGTINDANNRIQTGLNTTRAILDAAGEVTAGADMQAVGNEINQIASELQGELSSLEADIKKLEAPKFETSDSKAPESENVGELAEKTYAKSASLRLTYKDYLRIFLLFKDEDQLGQRTADLISLNVSHYRAEAGYKGESVIRTEEMYTYVSVSTEVELDFIFLTLPMFQPERSGLGIGPPRSFPIIETDYRGY